jgi:orotate phosphoribosyltransferase
MKTSQDSKAPAMPANRDRLQQLFRERALQFGDFTLASGQKSSYYVNSKRVLFHAEAITLLGELLYEATQDLAIEAIGGLEVGAIPMAAAALTAFHRHGKNVEGFFVRKKAKQHGSQDLIEGQVQKGDRVVVVDDVLTTGGSVIQAIRAVEDKGAKVVRVVCICDRLQGAAEALAGYDFRPLFTIRDFGIEPPVRQN